MNANDGRRRAFQLANLSAELAFVSEQLADQAMAIADAVLDRSDDVDTSAKQRGRTDDHTTTDDQTTTDDRAADSTPDDGSKR